MNTSWKWAIHKCVVHYTSSDRYTWPQIWGVYFGIRNSWKCGLDFRHEEHI